MKKFILILIAFLSVSTASFASDCGPKCPSTPWLSNVLTRSYGPCMITIYYSQRQCLAGKEIRLDKIVTSNECILSQDMAIEYATRYLLNSSFEIFGVIGNSINLGFSAECCWKTIGLMGTEITYEPCPEQNCCCETDFTVKKFVEFGVEKRRYIDSKTQTSDGAATFCGVECDKACDIFGDLTTGVGVSPVYSGDCIDSCDSPWNTGGGPLTKSYNGGTCVLELYYDWRECDDTLKVKISSMKYSGLGCGNLDDIMKEGFEKILSDVATKTTLDLIQVNIGTCWQYTTILGQDYVRSCYTDDCCNALYELTTTSGGHKIVSGSTTINSKSSVCRNLNGCTFICNTTHLGVPEDELLMKRAAESVEGNLLETTSEVIPNPATESISLNVNSKVDGNLLITITDVNGKTVYEITTNKNSVTIQVLINVKEFAKGTYFYNIRAGLYDINGGKFIKE